MINPNTVARIKACQGVYGLRDTAKYFNVSPATVHNVWTGKRHSDVPEAPEPPNVISTRVSPDVIVEDGRTLLERYNGDYEKAAAELGVSSTTLYRHTRKAPAVMVYG